jgi:hypothetical protein
MWLQIIASIFIIYLGHLCWNYLKNRFSKEKNRDLVQIQTRKYQKIIEEMQENKENMHTHTQNSSTESESIDPGTVSSNTESIDPLLQEDLESFMQQIM